MIEKIPIAGYVDSEIKNRDGLGLVFALGIMYIGSALGAFTIATGADPLIYGAIWNALGVALLVYSIIIKNRRES